MTTGTTAEAVLPATDWQWLADQLRAWPERRVHPERTMCEGVLRPMAADVIEVASARIAELEEALRTVMVGGNHLATVLIGHVGAGFSENFPPDMDPELALRTLCATDAYDVWCCWAAIMRARSLIREQGNA